MFLVKPQSTLLPIKALRLHCKYFRYPGHFKLLLMFGFLAQEAINVAAGFRLRKPYYFGAV